MIVICRPGCENAATKTPLEYQQAMRDFEHAIALLQSPAGCSADASRCYPGDVETINAYRDQLDELHRVLDKKNARFIVQFHDWT